MPLHPIMFLLNLQHITVLRLNLIVFTSHYVPIKSITTAETLTLRRVFTSHYVPIKSPCTLIYNPNHQSLHPIMFLLNQNIFPPRRLRGQNFTSHYVPIKSFVSKYR